MYVHACVCMHEPFFTNNSDDLGELVSRFA